MNSQLVHTDIAPASDAQSNPTILVLGKAATQFAAALSRLQPKTEVKVANKLAEAIELLRANAFSRVLVDNRNDDPALTMAVPKIASLKSVEKLVVLTGEASEKQLANLQNVAQLIGAPYIPSQIADALAIETAGSDRIDSVDQGPDQNIDKDVDTTTALHGLFNAVVRFIPGLTPIISLIYKNVALSMLCALFLAFISYGLMIAFFLTNDDWSSPLQLQRGHELVLKAERELGELQVKRNLILEKLANAEHEVTESRAALARADMLSSIVGSTIQQEKASLNGNAQTLEAEIEALAGVLLSYGSRDQRQAQRHQIQQAFNKRLITRDNYQSSMLNLSKLEESTISLREKLSAKREAKRQRKLSVEYLAHLEQHLNDNEFQAPVMQGTAQYIPLTNQVIEMKQLTAAGSSKLSQALQSIKSLQDSEQILTQSIVELQDTPMIKALNSPVNVLFVPYNNIHSFEQGQKLYTCALALFWCSQVGSVGDPIGGEVTTTHPFFGKPIRGQFVEANLTETSAAHKEIIHVGKPLLIF